jgi:hypothetical protein
MLGFTNGFGDEVRIRNCSINNRVLCRIELRWDELIRWKV